MTPDAVPSRQRTTLTANSDGSYTREPIPGMEVCDLCGAPTRGQRVAVYEVRPYTITVQVDGQSITEGSDDAWATCRACAALVDADRPSALLNRCVRMHAARQPRMRPDVLRTAVTTSLSIFHAQRVRP